MDAESIYRLINLSKTTLITFSCRHERALLEFLSKIPHKEVSLQCPTNLIRDSKIDSIINQEEEIKTFLIDFSKNSDMHFLIEFITKLSILRSSAKDIRLIIICPITQFMSSDFKQLSVSRLMYHCDLVVSPTYEDPTKWEVSKNRFSG